MEKPDYRCPKCGSTEDLCVVVSSWARLHQDDGEFSTETYADNLPDNDHEWDKTSCAGCSACGFRGKAADFAIYDEQEA